MIVMGIDPGPVHSGVVVFEKSDSQMEIVWTSRLGPTWEKNFIDTLISEWEKRRDIIPPGEKGTVQNNWLFKNISALANEYNIDYVIIEGIEHRGRLVGGSVFQTLIWIGLFTSKFNEDDDVSSPHVRLMLPSTIRTILCGSPQTSGNEIRGALIERYGEVGTKKNPGFLYPLAKPRICNHLFDAMAVAQAFFDMTPKQFEELSLPQWYWSDKNEKGKNARQL